MYMSVTTLFIFYLLLCRQNCTVLYFKAALYCTKVHQQLNYSTEECTHTHKYSYQMRGVAGNAKVTMIVIMQLMRSQLVKEAEEEENEEKEKQDNEEERL